MASPIFHLHLVSDATGETLESMAKAATAQFEQVHISKHFWPMIRTAMHMARVMDEIERRPGLVMFTLVREEIRDVLVQRCDAAGLPYLSVLDPVVGALGQYLGREATHRPGRQHALDSRYFDRIEALDYTMEHDDGRGLEELADAHMVLVGVSRTSKTPTSLYLANRGYRVANVPYVPGRPMPPELDGLRGVLVVGLTTSPERLIQIRTHRLRQLNQDRPTDYVDVEQVREEVRDCRRYCTKRGWPLIDVSRRSIEETAAEVLNLYQLQLERQEAGY